LILELAVLMKFSRIQSLSTHATSQSVSLSVSTQPFERKRSRIVLWKVVRKRTGPPEEPPTCRERDIAVAEQAAADESQTAALPSLASGVGREI